jgi:hypothetical protein
VALEKAINERGSRLFVNSAYRTLLNNSCCSTSFGQGDVALLLLPLLEAVTIRVVWRLTLKILMVGDHFLNGMAGDGSVALTQCTLILLEAVLKTSIQSQSKLFNCSGMKTIQMMSLMLRESLAPKRKHV